MYDLTIGDFIRIVVKSLLLTMIIAPLFIGLFYLIHINVDFAYYISIKRYGGKKCLKH